MKNTVSSIQVYLHQMMEIIKEKIVEAGYTQKQFAEEVLGIKRLALYRKIKGESTFNKLEKEKIKEVLNIDIDSL